MLGFGNRDMKTIDTLLKAIPRWVKLQVTKNTMTVIIKLQITINKLTNN